MGHAPSWYRPPMGAVQRWWWILVSGLGVACHPGGAGGVASPAPTLEPTCEDQGLLTDVDGSCAPVVCGVGPWGPADDGSAAVFVLEGGDGDGSAEAPLGSVQEAVETAAAAGVDRVVVGGGVYPGRLDLGRAQNGLTIQGRCRDRVVLDGEGDARESAVELEASARVTLAGVELRGWPEGGVMVWTGTLVVNDARVSDSGEYGLAASGSSSALVVRDTEVTTLYDDAEDTPEGVAAASGASVDLTRVQVFGYTGLGLYVRDATLTVTDSSVYDLVGTGASVSGQSATLRFSGLEVREVRAETRAAYAPGVFVENGGRLEGTTLDLAAIDGVGMLASGEGTVAELAQVTAVGVTRVGIEVAAGGSLGLEEASIREGSGTGLLVDGYTAIGPGGPVTTATVSGLLVEGLSANEDGEGLGNGVVQLGRSRLTIADSTLAGNALAGMIVSGEAEVEATGLQVRDNRQGGLLASRGARLSCGACTLEGNGQVAVYADSADLLLVDTTIADTGPAGGELTSGWGVAVFAGEAEGGPIAVPSATLRLRNVDVLRSHGVGVGVYGARAVADFEGVRVRDTRLVADWSSAAGVALAGVAPSTLRGLEVEDGAGPGLAMLAGDVSCLGCRLARNGGAGVVVDGGSVFRLEASEVVDNGPAPSVGGGFGIAVLGGESLVEVDRTSVAGSALAALYVDAPGSVHVSASTLTAGPAPAGAVAWPQGNAAFATGPAAAGLTFTDVELVGAGGGALFLHAASATLEGVTFSGDDVDVVQQACGGVEPVVGIEAAATTERCPTWDRRVEAWTWSLELALPDVGG